MGLPIIGKILGHSQPATTARYAHLASDPVKAAAAVAGKIAAAMGGGSGDAGTGGGTVLPLRSGTQDEPSGISPASRHRRGCATIVVGRARGETAILDLVHCRENFEVIFSRDKWELQMTLAERIRRFAFEHYVSPASAVPDAKIRIRAGNVHQEMMLTGRMPAVCGALARDSLDDAGPVAGGYARHTAYGESFDATGLLSDQRSGGDKAASQENDTSRTACASRQSNQPV
jgi:hypothetical protein